MVSKCPVCGELVEPLISENLNFVLPLEGTHWLCRCPKCHYTCKINNPCGTWPAPKDKPAPAAPDTVQVVRCGKCMHRGNPDVCPWSHKELRQYAEGTRWVITDGTVFDGFCHLGAKGDGGG